MSLHSAANDFSVLQRHRDASLGDGFLTFLDHRAVSKGQAPITQGSSVMPQKNGYVEVNRNSR